MYTPDDDDVEFEAPEVEGRYDGTESSESIWVAIDPNGRLLSVDLSRSWRDRLQPDQFADALFVAYAEAANKVVAAKLAGGRAETEKQNDDELSPDALAALPPEEWLAVSRARLERVDATLRALPEGTSVPEREVRSPNGYLALRLRGNDLVGITGNTDALRLAKSNLLRQDVIDVFQDAELSSAR